MSAILPTATTQHVSITSFGAVADGVTNNQAAIQKAFDYAAANGDAVYIPAGNFAYFGTLSADGIAVFGAGTSSILTPLDVTNEALTLTGSGGSISNLQMDSSAATRLTTYQSSMIWIDQAQNYTVQNVLINGSSCVGIFDAGGQDGLIQNNTVENTLADSITNTNGASNVTITANRVVNSGDDGISNVSYAGAPIVQGITIQGNTVIDNNWGRGISVVGGSNIQITGNYVDNNDLYSDIYIAAESQYDTLGVNNVTVSGNTLVDGGPNQGTVTVYNSQGSAYNITGVTITGNQVVNPANNAFQFCGNGNETVALNKNSVYTSGSNLSSNSNSLAVVSALNNTILNPTAYTTPLVAPGGGVTTAPTTPPPPSPNDTVVMVRSGAAISDASGNAWTITSGGQIAVNGVTDAVTSNVIELAYVNGRIWQENTSGLWYGKTKPSGSWSAGTTVSPLKTITISASEANVSVAAISATINVTSGNHTFIISGHSDTFNLSGGVETITDRGSGSMFRLPAAGHGSAIFNAAVLSNGDVFDLTSALDGTAWTGSASTLSSYLHTRQSDANTELLVSATATRHVAGTLLATFGGSTSLSTILAHSAT